MLGLKTVDRNDYLKPAQRGPFNRNRPDGARDDLRVDASIGESRQNLIQLAETHQRLAADDRDVKGLMLFDELEEP